VQPHLSPQSAPTTCCWRPREHRVWHSRDRYPLRVCFLLLGRKYLVLVLCSDADANCCHIRPSQGAPQRPPATWRAAIEPSNVEQGRVGGLKRQVASQQSWRETSCRPQTIPDRYPCRRGCRGGQSRKPGQRAESKRLYSRPKTSMQPEIGGMPPILKALDRAWLGRLPLAS